MSAAVMTPKVPRVIEAKAPVYCPICTHTVQVMVTFAGKHARVTPGQKCPRCSSPIDAGFVMRQTQAA